MGNKRQTRVFAPATVANLGPGFDVLGLALSGPGDTVTARLVDGEGVTIRAIRGDGGVLPLDAARNTAGVAATATLARAGMRVGVELEIDKGMPIGSGLGSSAASAAAAAFAVNELVGAPLRRQDLVEPCMEAEASVSGRHADNVAPALLGGLVMVRSVDPLDLQRVPLPAGLQVVVVSPRFELATRVAREVLPATVSLGEMVRNGANVATFISACYSGDLSLFSRCLHDEVITPRRAALIPGANAVMDAARDAGALGSSISGSGPSIFAFCHSPQSAARVAAAMVAAFGGAGLEATAVVSPADCPGARIL